MDPAILGTSINTVWVLIAAFLVFFMQAGFGMLEAGLIRSKNTVNILMKNFFDFCIASVAFLAIGYAFMFGPGNDIIGTKGFFLQGLEPTVSGLPLLGFWLFQVVFCGAAATIVAGAVAERTRFPAYLIYSLFISAFLYPLIGHWAWGGGWLAKLGFLDFAGSTVVHAVGGFAGLAGAIIVGSRLGRWTEKSHFHTGHNIPLAALGVLILWFGWFGFNGGSSLSASDPGLISKIVVNTNVAAAMGGIVALFMSWIFSKKPDAGMAMNGILAGLVAITAPCAFVTPVTSLIIGGIGGIVMSLGVTLLEKLKIDDPVGAWPVHGLTGLWGTLSVGLFHTELGLFYGAGLKQFGVQALGTFASALTVFVVMLVLFSIIKATVGLRVSPQVEEQGLDLGEHFIESYPEFHFRSDEFAPALNGKERSHRPPTPAATPMKPGMPVGRTTP